MHHNDRSLARPHRHVHIFSRKLSMTSSADVCIIGAGIAGLYSAYVLRKQRGPQCKIVIVEADDRVGGRALVVPFAGQEVLDGAGVGRWSKDLVLRALLCDMGLSVRRFHVPRHPVHDAVIRGALADLRAAAAAETETFRDFGRRVLGPERYAAFVHATGFTDYEDAAAIHTLRHYGFDDTIGGRDFFMVPWKELIDGLVASARAEIYTSCRVTKITARDGSCDVICNTRKIHAAQVVVAVTASGLHRLFGKRTAVVRAQPFLRIYARFAPGPALDALTKAVPGHMVVAAPLQKIIPMRDGVFMIAYSDNASAVALRSEIQKAGAARRLEALVEQATGVSGLRITDLHSKFWKEGTHYFAPGKSESEYQNVQRPWGPDHDVWVVGEAVSATDQGWVEGALKSVLKIEINLKQAGRHIIS